MKLYALLFVSTFAFVGCSSSNNNPSTDGGDTAGGDTTGGDTTGGDTTGGDTTGGMIDEQTATYNGLAWREVASVATLSLSNSLLEEFDQSLDTAAQALGVSGSTGTEDCANGGTLSWQNTVAPFGHGTESFLQYDFEDCEIDGTTFDGLFDKSNRNFFVQSSFSSTTTRAYDLKVLGSDTDTEIKGEWIDLFNSGVSFTCGSGETESSREANFEIIKTDLLLNQFYVDALGLDNEDDTISLGSSSEGTCDRYVVASANDTSTIRLASISNASFNVVRSGNYQLTAPVDETLGDPQDAMLKVISVGSSQNTLTIQSNGAGNNLATVTIAENGSVIAFESTWEFEGEASGN